MKKKTMFPMNQRQFLANIELLFGKGYVMRHFNISQRSVNRHTSEKRDVSEEGARDNILERFEKVLEDLMISGGEAKEWAKLSVDRFARIVGCELVCIDVTPDQEDLDAECLDDYPALTAFHSAVRAGKPEVVTRKLKMDLIAELNETHMAAGAKKR